MQLKVYRPSQINIHYDRKLTIEPAVDGRNQHLQFYSCSFQLQNLTFESDSTSVYLKNKQYYFTFVIMLMRILAYQDIYYNYCVNLLICKRGAGMRFLVQLIPPSLFLLYYFVFKYYNFRNVFLHRIDLPCGCPQSVTDLALLTVKISSLNTLSLRS